MSNFFLVVTSAIDETQRTLIHAAVKENADEWWHELPDMWILEGGGSAAYWGSILKVFVPHQPSSVYIFKLPEIGGRNWHAASKAGQFDWIISHYSKPNGSGPTDSREIEPA